MNRRTTQHIDTSIKILCTLLFLTALHSCATTAQELHPFRNTAPGGYHFWMYTPPVTADSAHHITESAAKSHKRRKHGKDAVLKPLIVFLHGASLCGRNLHMVRRYGTLDALDRGRKIDAYVLAPQNPGGAWKPEKLMNLCEWAFRNYDIDTTRVYVLGMSLGGYGTIDFAAAYPHRIAAAMALCGGGTSKTLGNLNQLPLWILHGTADRAVPVGASDKVVAAMQAAGPTNRLIFSRLKGYNHGQPARIFYMKETYEWLLSHSLKDKDRPVNRSVTINTTNIPLAYRDLGRKGALAARTNGHIEADTKEHVKQTSITNPRP
ncbi:MAG: phospholipase [Bacteroidaceae bacterium]|nr:phospholipase [Bacteroidaceae bacterium]